MEKIDIVFLGAGDSKRFGSKNKLLYEVDGKKMFQIIVDNFFKLKNKYPQKIERLIMVSKYEEVEKYFNNLNCDNLFYIKNNHSEEGISWSIKLGLSKCKKSNFIIFVVCDQPFLTFKTLEKFILNFLESKKELGCVAGKEDKKLGNPCIFSEKYKKELEMLYGDIGGKKIIKKYLDKVFIMEVENKRELRDIDFL